MDWKALFTMQKQLDAYIETNQGIEEQDVFHKKYLALLVELGELANETRCFKFWSTKARSERSVILEEYVDGIHFILSLGIEKGYHYNGREIVDSEQTETQQFNNVYERCVLFKQNSTRENYEKMFESYLQLGRILGFNEEDVHDAYFKKNEINYKRQNQGY
ncbi:dUTP diphosphatase [Virgibacillus ainsalahensis]